MSTDHVLKLENANLRNESYAGRVLAQFVSVGSKFTKCDFRNIKVMQACFGGGQVDSIYIECVFDGSQICAKAPGFAVFERCSFENVVFIELNCRNVEFIDCKFSGEIRKGFFNGTTSNEARNALQRHSNRFRGNNFQHSKLGDVAFRTGIDLTQQILPIGEEYLYLLDPETTITHARMVREKLTEEEKASLDVLLKLFERDIALGQKQLFFNVGAFPLKIQRAFEVIRRMR